MNAVEDTACLGESVEGEDGVDGVDGVAASVLEEGPGEVA